VFTPADDTAFNDFSFRGQLNKSGFTGTVDVIWTDSAGKTGTIVFTGVKGPNADFDRLGIVATHSETLKSAEIFTPGTESFKQVKQIEFSFAPTPIPEPATLALVGTSLVGLGFARRRRNFGAGAAYDRRLAR
jgi:hypothetical protein